MFGMKKFYFGLSNLIITMVIIGVTQFAVADHTEPGEGIYKTNTITNIADIRDSNYQVYLQAVIRNGDGQLVNVTESISNGAYIPHQITDHAFDTLFGKKTNIVIDNITYEKVEYVNTPTPKFRYVGLYPIFTEIPFTFEETPEGKIRMETLDQDYAVWLIHYCAIFEGHAYDCIPIFQVLVPNMTMEPDDVITLKWTILKKNN